jgi:hypothetical protein
MSAERYSHWASVRSIYSVPSGVFAESTLKMLYEITSKRQMFDNTFSITDRSAYAGGSAFDAIWPEAVGTFPQPGVYNDGLLTVLDDAMGTKMLADWRSLLEWRNVTALMVTGFGNVLFADRDSGELFFLDVQEVEMGFVGDDVRQLLNMFLVHPGVIEDVLRGPRLAELVQANRPLKYGECFILVPWLMFGGRDEVGRYDIGSCSVYVELVRQTHLQASRRRV